MTNLLRDILYFNIFVSIYITFKLLLLVGEPPVLVMVTEGVPHPQTDLDLIHSEQ